MKKIREEEKCYKCFYIHPPITQENKSFESVDISVKLPSGNGAAPDDWFQGGRGFPGPLPLLLCNIS